jgi:hypothetical protein
VYSPFALYSPVLASTFILEPSTADLAVTAVPGSYKLLPSIVRSSLRAVAAASVHSVLILTHALRRTFNGTRMLPPVASRVPDVWILLLDPS